MQVNLGITSFVVDFYLLLVSGAEVILGIQWLKTLGYVLMDYSNLHVV